MSQIQRHLFILDPLDKLNLRLDSSLRMARSLSRLGHECWYATVQDLSWESGAACAKAAAKKLLFSGEDLAQVKTEQLPHGPVTIDTFTAVHNRKDPPFDENYIVLTWILESALGKTHLFNEPQALRSLNEKTGILLFPEATEAAFIGNDPEAFYQAWTKKFEGDDVIIKPLTLFGGRGVLKLDKSLLSNKDKALDAIRVHTGSGEHWRILQRFVPKVTEGEIRAFCVGGKPVAWCMKKPSVGNYLANTAAGATLHQVKPDAALVAKVTKVAERLMKIGIAFVGLDIIADMISEINITSPRLLQAPDDTTDYYEGIAKWIEKASAVPTRTKHWAP